MGQNVFFFFASGGASSADGVAWVSGGPGGVFGGALGSKIVYSVSIGPFGDFNLPNKVFYRLQTPRRL